MVYIMLKDKLRKQFIKLRSNIVPSEKEKKDQKIFENIIKTKEYKNCDILLCYIATENEIETKNLINKAIKDKKTVAVPFSLPDFNLEFYKVNSIDKLKKGILGIKEPEQIKANKIENFKNALAIIPAVCFSKDFHRIGYGKGYYDRFLKNFDGVSMGLCVSECIIENDSQHKWSEENDITVDIIVTETEIARKKY